MTTPITVKRDNLLQALQAVQSAVTRKHVHEILRNVLIRIDGLTGTVIGSCLDLEIQANFVMDDPARFETTVDARKLLDIVKQAPTESLKVRLSDDNTMKITTGRSRFSLRTLPPADYPLVATETPIDTLSIPEQLLASLIDRVGYSMAVHDVRYYLNGAMIHAAGGCLTAVSTDGHRLSLSEQESQHSSDTKESTLIIPRDTVILLGKTLSLDATDDMTLELFTNHLRLKKAGLVITTKLIDGKFPDYHRVLPKTPSTTVVADRAMLLSLLKRAAVIAAKAHGVQVTIGQGALQASVSSRDDGDFNESMVIDHDGNDIEIGFNLHYLVDAVQACHGEKVILRLSGTGDAVKIEDPDDSKTLFLVMPVRI